MAVAVTKFWHYFPDPIPQVQSSPFGEVATGVLPVQASIRIREEQRVAFARSSPDVRN